MLLFTISTYAKPKSNLDPLLLGEANGLPLIYLHSSWAWTSFGLAIQSFWAMLQTIKISRRQSESFLLFLFFLFIHSFILLCPVAHTTRYVVAVMFCWDIVLTTNCLIFSWIGGKDFVAFNNQCSMLHVTCNNDVVFSQGTCLPVKRCIQHTCLKPVKSHATC